MSKCDLRVVFDRADRQYRGGQQVTGTVYVQVNQDVECNGIVLEHFWQTHGRGNRATGPKLTTTLYRGPLQAGQSLSYPFRFPAPNGPPTYHGRYLNIDHYVRVRVDIPWAIDPNLQEEYVLLPSGRRYGNLPSLSGGSSTARQLFANLGWPIGVTMVFVGFFLLFPCGVVLIPLGLAVLFFALRQTLAEKKIGKVRLSCGSPTVAPGTSLPLRLTFTPNQTSRLNQITAKLVGKERCVSGSGTNRTTHTHKLHERTVVLVSECEITAGRSIQVEGLMPIPATNAFSFHASDNDLIWELEVRVDIPLWPDWVERRSLVVRPPIEPEVVEATVVEEPPAAAGAAEVLPPVPDFQQPVAEAQPPPVEPAIAGTPLDQPGPVAAGGAEPPGPPAEADAERPFEEPLPAEPPISEETPAAEVPVEQPPPAPAVSTDPALVGIVERIASADRYSRAREEIISENSERSFDCAIEIARTERTYNYIPDTRFRKGRTVTGKLQGTDCEVSVELVAERNEEVDALEPDSLLRAKCRPLKWNTMYDRLEMREA